MSLVWFSIPIAWVSVVGCLRFIGLNRFGVMTELLCSEYFLGRVAKLMMYFCVMNSILYDMDVQKIELID